MIPEKEALLKYVTFKTSRSGGKGGQNVNKVSSKVEVILNLDEAEFLTAEQKQRIMLKLANRLDQVNNIHVIAQEDRSQLINKQRSIDKLIHLLRFALHVEKIRKPTKTPKSILRKRLEDKQSTAIKKLRRQRPLLD